MTRPKAKQAKQRAGSEGPQAAPTQQQQQQQQAAAAQQQQQAAAKKRPAEGGAPGAAAAPAAAAAAGGEPPEVDQLERKRMQVAEELRQVEKQARVGAARLAVGLLAAAAEAWQVPPRACGSALRGTVARPLLPATVAPDALRCLRPAPRHPAPPQIYDLETNYFQVGAARCPRRSRVLAFALLRALDAALPGPLRPRSRVVRGPCTRPRATSTPAGVVRHGQRGPRLRGLPGRVQEGGGAGAARGAPLLVVLGHRPPAAARAGRRRGGRRRGLSPEPGPDVLCRRLAAPLGQRRLGWLHP